MISLFVVWNLIFSSLLTFAVADDKQNDKQSKSSKASSQIEVQMAGYTGPTHAEAYFSNTNVEARIREILENGQFKPSFMQDADGRRISVPQSFPLENGSHLVLFNPNPNDPQAIKAVEIVATNKRILALLSPRNLLAAKDAGYSNAYDFIIDRLNFKNREAEFIQMQGNPFKAWIEWGYDPREISRIVIEETPLDSASEARIHDKANALEKEANASCADCIKNPYSPNALVPYRSTNIVPYNPEQNKNSASNKADMQSKYERLKNQSHSVLRRQSVRRARTAVTFAMELASMNISMMAMVVTGVGLAASSPLAFDNTLTQMTDPVGVASFGAFYAGNHAVQHIKHNALANLNSKYGFYRGILAANPHQLGRMNKTYKKAATRQPLKYQELRTNAHRVQYRFSNMLGLFGMGVGASLSHLTGEVLHNEAYLEWSELPNKADTPEEAIVLQNRYTAAYERLYNTFVLDARWIKNQVHPIFNMLVASVISGAVTSGAIKANMIIRNSDAVKNFKVSFGKVAPNVFSFLDRYAFTKGLSAAAAGAAARYSAQRAENAALAAAKAASEPKMARKWLKAFSFTPGGAVMMLGNFIVFMYLDELIRPITNEYINLPIRKRNIENNKTQIYNLLVNIHNNQKKQTTENKPRTASQKEEQLGLDMPLQLDRRYMTLVTERAALDQERTMRLSAVGFTGLNAADLKVASQTKVPTQELLFNSIRTYSARMEDYRKALVADEQMILQDWQRLYESYIGQYNLISDAYQSILSQINIAITLQKMHGTKSNFNIINTNKFTKDPAQFIAALKNRKLTKMYIYRDMDIRAENLRPEYQVHIDDFKKWSSSDQLQALNLIENFCALEKNGFTNKTMAEACVVPSAIYLPKMTSAEFTSNVQKHFVELYKKADLVKIKSEALPKPDQPLIVQMLDPMLNQYLDIIKERQSSSNAALKAEGLKIDSNATYTVENADEKDAEAKAMSFFSSQFNNSEVDNWDYVIIEQMLISSNASIYHSYDANLSRAEQEGNMNKNIFNKNGKIGQVKVSNMIDYAIASMLCGGQHHKENINYNSDQMVLKAKANIAANSYSPDNMDLRSQIRSDMYDGDLGDLPNWKMPSVTKASDVVACISSSNKFYSLDKNRELIETATAMDSARTSSLNNYNNRTVKPVVAKHDLNLIEINSLDNKTYFGFVNAIANRSFLKLAQVSLVDDTAGEKFAIELANFQAARNEEFANKLFIFKDLFVEFLNKKIQPRFVGDLENSKLRLNADPYKNPIVNIFDQSIFLLTSMYKLAPKLHTNKAFTESLLKLYKMIVLASFSKNQEEAKQLEELKNTAKKEFIEAYKAAYNEEIPTEAIILENNAERGRMESTKDAWIPQIVKVSTRTATMAVMLNEVMKLKDHAFSYILALNFSELQLEDSNLRIGLDRLRANFENQFSNKLATEVYNKVQIQKQKAKFELIQQKMGEKLFPSREKSESEASKAKNPVIDFGNSNSSTITQPSTAELFNSK